MFILTIVHYSSKSFRFLLIQFTLLINVQWIGFKPETEHCHIMLRYDYMIFPFIDILTYHPKLLKRM